MLSGMVFGGPAFEFLEPTAEQLELWPHKLALKTLTFSLTTGDSLTIDLAFGRSVGVTVHHHRPTA